MRKLFGCTLGLLLSFGASAEVHAPKGYSWSGPYTVKSVTRNIDGIHRVAIEFNEDLDTTCNLNNTMGWATNTGNNYTLVDSMLSLALAAQAQNKKVNIMLGGSCHSTFGLNLWGITILSD
ncbi:hypothetical protein EK599_05270 [Vibrio sp. T187]|uniref:hypothetical protein n=1 Tax=Vibrio TaxID=662 RepID=UPI0010C9DFF0|nr:MULTISPECIES: hypothetical protein [Vibrio]MBW3695091.1 hypothetical protein [Vibrio sp. T187]